MHCLILGLLVCLVGKSHGLSFSKTFDSNMVLQRDVPASIWGFADVEGETIQVVFDGDVYPTTAFSLQNGDILWWLQLDPRPAGEEAYQIVLRNLDQSEVYSIDNVLFGDVWFCSGQSNMVHSMSRLDDPDPDLEDSVNYPDVRIFRGRLESNEEPQTDVENPVLSWSLPDKDTVRDFSAICWLFGRNMNRELGVPMGLIDSTWGGTRIEAWSSADALAQCGDDQSRPMTFDTGLFNAMVNPYLRMAIKGANWYQGEANRGPQDVPNYACQQAAMIGDWGAKWNQFSATPTDFPFGVVQLSGNRLQTLDTGFSEVRWAQTANYGYTPNDVLPNVFMAVSLDLPDPESPYGSIHPRYKRPIAERLMLGALPIAYGINSRGRFQGPFPTSITPAGNNLIIEYDNLQSELDIRGVNGFEVCCADEGSAECSSWGNAPITSEDNGAVTLFVDCQDQVPRILRYLWRETPCELQQCAIYSVENDLPAPPFIFEL